MRKKELIKKVELLEKELKQKEKELNEKENLIVRLKDELEREIKRAEFREKSLTEDRDYWYKKVHDHWKNVFVEADKYINNLRPKRIIHNENATIVWFNDEKVVVKLAPGETGDVYSAVAYAIAKHMYKNNTQFKKFVDWKLADKRGKK